MNELPPPGWYPDHGSPHQERWWDGRGWSPMTRPSLAARTTVAPPSAQPSAQPSAPPEGQPGAGYAPGHAPGYAPAYGKQPRVTPDGVRLASWGRRVVARLLDDVLVWTIVVVVGRGPIADLWRIMSDEMRRAVRAAEAGTTYSSFGLMDNQAYVDAIWHLTLIYVLVSAIYDIPFVAMRGATPGKLALGLRVRPWEGPGTPTWPASVVRWSVWGLVPALIPVLGALFWWLDMLFPLWDRRRQALHDKAARTVVVRIR